LHTQVKVLQPDGTSRQGVIAEIIHLAGQDFTFSINKDHPEQLISVRQYWVEERGAGHLLLPNAKLPGVRLKAAGMVAIVPPEVCM
jgi:hypothetical protein